jgi:hypothetical protein
MASLMFDLILTFQLTLGSFMMVAFRAALN